MSRATIGLIIVLAVGYLGLAFVFAMFISGIRLPDLERFMIAFLAGTGCGHALWPYIRDLIRDWD